MDSRRALLTIDEHDNFWDSAPDELIARIIALLPGSDIHLARGVCRRWRSIALSPFFLSLCKKWLHGRKPWLLEFQQKMYNQAWAFDLDGRQWFHMSFFFLPENAHILASSGGLVCLGRASKEGYILYVCNPITKKWRELPELLWKPDVVLLDVNHDAGTYKVAVLLARGNCCTSRPFGSIAIFDSRSGAWVETCEVPEMLCDESLEDASLSGKFLCCILPPGLVMFNVDEAKWEYMGLGILESELFSNGFYIFNRGGKLNAVIPHHWPGMQIIEYDLDRRRWGLVRPANNVLVCAGCFSSLCCRVPEKGSHICLVQADGHKSYSSTSRSWSTLRKSPLTQRKIQGREILIKCIWFELHIDATP